MSDLPAGWAWATIGEIAETSLGKMLDRKQATGKDPTPYLRNINVRWGKFDLDDIASMDIRPKELDRVLARPGDVIACEGGEPGRAAVWRGPAPIALQKALHRIRPSSAVIPQYLALLLRHLSTSRALTSLFTGTTIKHLPQEKLRLVRVPLAPFEEQQRIVAAAEEHLSRLDAAEALLRRVRKRLSGLRKAAFLALIPATPPRNWISSTVQEAGHVDLGRQRSPKWHSGPNMRPYLRVKNVFEDRIDLSDVMQMNFSPQDYEKYKLEPGDILLNEGQSPELVGRAAIYRGELPGACFTNSLIRFRPCPEVDGDFALLVFRRHLHAGRFRREARITTNIAHMAAGRFKTVEFPIPPLEEQRAIVIEAQRQLSIIDALEVTMASSLTRRTSVLRAILDSAFSGELAHQDPTDEPASVLLERIRTRSEAAATSRRRKSGS